MKTILARWSQTLSSPDDALSEANPESYATLAGRISAIPEREMTWLSLPPVGHRQMTPIRFEKI